MATLKKHIHNLKIRHRFMIGILMITTATLMLISTLTYSYFSNRYEQQAISNTQYTLTVGSQTIDTLLFNSLSNATRIVSSQDMLNVIYDIQANRDDKYIYNYVTLDSYFTELIQSNDYISGAFMIDKNNRFYSASSIGLKYADQDLLGLSTVELHGITILPEMDNPFSTSNKVLPLVIPLRYEDRMDNVFVSDAGTDLLFKLVILINADVITNYFDHINNNPGSALYLASSDFTPLTVLPDSNYDSIAFTPTFKEDLSSLSDEYTITSSYLDDDYLITYETIDFQDLTLVSIIRKNDLLAQTRDIEAFIFISWVLSAAFSTLLAFIISRYMTRPIKRLVSVVDSIEEGTYTEILEPEYNDEIGVLNHSINSMHATINEQIHIIREDAAAQAKAEIDILTNQINPHFLYNTLSSIQLEILNQHSKEAASMVESLGSFLRIGLNSGSRLIPIKQEVKHVREYINLMNHMSNLDIQFVTDIDPSLMDVMVIKFILQPLVENSIKHGFQKDGISQNILTPTIQLMIHKVSDAIHIEVSDNGCGMDVSAMERHLYENPLMKKKGHIGLFNIYRRLSVYYNNDIDIEFLSIPFYQNSVILKLPFVKEV